MVEICRDSFNMSLNVIGWLWTKKATGFASWGKTCLLLCPLNNTIYVSHDWGLLFLRLSVKSGIYWFLCRCSPQCTCLGFWFMLGVLVIRVSFHMRPVHLTIWWLRVDIGLCLLEPHLSTAAVSLGLFWRGQTDSELWRHTVCRACHHLPFINMTTVCIICTYVLYHPPMAVCLHFLMNVFGAPQSAAGLKEIGVSFRIVKQGMRGAASTGGQTRRLCSRPQRY